jgi:hypothetical protein
MRSFFARSRARQLEEVKAILHRLQALSAESGSGVPTAALEKASHPNGVAGRRARAAGLGLLSGLAIIGFGAYVLKDLGQSAGRSPGARPTESSEGSTFSTHADQQPIGKLEASTQSILEKAVQDLAAGHVKAARDALIASQHRGSADMAWTLARSYDPNFLGEIAHRDAEPNVTEAALWYRIWYSRAVTDGLVADSISLERILGSMPDASPELATVK